MSKINEFINNRDDELLEKFTKLKKELFYETAHISDMELISLYEGKDVDCSHKYNRYLHITDPFLSPRLHKISLKRFSRNGNLDIKRIVHKLDPDNEGLDFLEFKFTNTEILKHLSDNKEEFKLDRYIVEWNSGGYFLKRYLASVYRVDGDIIVFKVNFLEIIEEDVIRRDMKLDILLN